MAVAIRSTLGALRQWLGSVAEKLRSTARLCHGMRVLSWHWGKVRDCVEDMGITPLVAAPVKGRSCTAEKWRSLAPSTADVAVVGGGGALQRQI